jgi:dephospho-CoA kinase
MHSTKNLPVVAVVGGIGSGKSVVARELARQGGYLIQGDDLGHEALADLDIRRRVVERFGPEILDEKGNIVRRKLGRIVFADPAALRDLETLVFPFIGRRIEEEIETAAGPGVGFVVLDAAVALEAGWTQRLNRLIYVDSPRDLRLARLQERGWNEEELDRRERVQMPLEEKRRRADAVIVNDAGLDKLREQVATLIERWGWKRP